MLKALKNLKVRHKVRSSCCAKKNTTFIYILPVRLDKSIEGAMKSLGENALSFDKTLMLKIENADYSIIGINKLKEVKLILKNRNATSIVNKFENALAAYVKSRKKAK